MYRSGLDKRNQGDSSWRNLVKRVGSTFSPVALAFSAILVLTIVSTLQAIRSNILLFDNDNRTNEAIRSNIVRFDNDNRTNEAIRSNIVRFDNDNRTNDLSSLSPTATRSEIKWTARQNGTRYNGTCLGSSRDPLFDWQKRAPYFAIMGAQKGGTKALHAYLAEHYLVAENQLDRHETHFFDNLEKSRGEKFRHEQVDRLPEGIPQEENQRLYAKRYTKNRDSILLNRDRFAFDDSPRYMLLSDRVPDAIFCIAPWMKLIAVLRHPIERIVSQFNMHSESKHVTIPMEWNRFLGSDLQLLREYGVLQNWSEVDFDTFAGSEEEALAWEDYLQNYEAHVQELPLGRSLYAIQLGHYFKAMDKYGKPRSDFLAVQSEEMRANITEVYEKVLNFLNLPSFDLMDAKLVHTTKASVPLPDDWREFMEDFFEPYNQRLYKLLDWDPVWDKEKD